MSDKKGNKFLKPKEDEFPIHILEASCNPVFGVAGHTFRATAVINKLGDNDLITKSVMNDLIVKYQNTKVRG